MVHIYVHIAVISLALSDYGSHSEKKAYFQNVLSLECYHRGSGHQMQFILKAQDGR